MVCDVFEAAEGDGGVEVDAGDLGEGLGFVAEPVDKKGGVLVYEGAGLFAHDGGGINARDEGLSGGQG